MVAIFDSEKQKLIEEHLRIVSLFIRTIKRVIIDFINKSSCKRRCLK